MNNCQMKILIADDEKMNLEVLRRILMSVHPQNPSGKTDPLQSCYTLCVAKSGQATLKKAEEEKPDLILLDIVMPDMNGFDVLASLKKSESTRDIPVIFITGLDSVEDEEKGFSLGAVDYITKPFHSSLVKARVKTHLRIVEQMRTIEMLGLIDTLTNMPNRRGFDNQMTTEWGHAIREKKPVSLLMIDIDNFKIFNDTYGHQQGDSVLRTVAAVVKSTLKRSTDFAARWGGEELAVILPNTDIDGAINVAESIRLNIENEIIFSLRDASPLNVTVSIGVTSAMPDLSSIIDEFIALADEALYSAKEAGRNKVCSSKTERSESLL